ncbi:PucR family transcriptional regulator [Gandjariella thermophila]|uniref:PucR family transcriptional regulator n=1 Tax=Gandjariella thermophila TaxID=1931992 RepID=A0A4D4J4U7_9PSEU|nr:helix-turn-helix domain-containing protein [Gandjariella thermophila]GDY31541.1 hypothetical protein GTS_31740 [Gandjariella thermophila]
MAVETPDVVQLGPRGVPATLVGQLLADIDGVNQRLVDAILADNRGYLDSSLVSLADLRRSCRNNVERVLQILADAVPDGVPRYGPARETGRQRALQRVPLDDVLRSYRLGGRVIWQALLEAARAGGGIDPADLLDVGTSVWTVVDAVSSEVARSYRETELDLIRQDDQRRNALIDQLLRGRGRDHGFAQTAARTLGLPADGRYLVVAAEAAEDGGTAGRPALACAADALAGCGIRSVWQLRGEGLVGLVALEQHGADAVLAELRPRLRGRAAAAPPVTGLDEVGSAYEMARTALHTLAPGQRQLITLDERLPESLLMRSPELARRLVEVTLRPVLELPPHERDALLTTVATWFSVNCSAAHAAATLYCHRNTVLNRLNRFEELTGQRLHHRADSLTLGLALIAVRLGFD